MFCKPTEYLLKEILSIDLECTYVTVTTNNPLIWMEFGGEIAGIREGNGKKTGRTVGVTNCRIQN
jgi:hypothetical protein